MWPERLFGLLLIGMGTLVLLIAGPNLLVAWRRGANIPPILVTFTFGGLLASTGLATFVLSFTRGRSVAVGRILTVLAEPLGILGVSLGALAGFLVGVHESAAAPVFAAVSAGCLVSAFTMTVRGRRHLASSAAEEEARDPRPPVLYLRSFQADEETARVTESFGSRTEEELTVEVLQAFGPVVAIGRPGERLPETGAARMYVDDEDWQEVVAEYMDRSALVVLRLGTTMGFLWELERATRTLDPTRLLVLSPYDRKSYGVFRSETEEYFPEPLPDLADGSTPGLQGGRLGSVRGAILFQPDWTAEYVDLAAARWPWSYTFATFGRQRLHRVLLWSLRSLFERNGAAWCPRPRWSGWQVVNVVACLAGAGFLARDASNGSASIFGVMALSGLLLLSALLRLSIEAVRGVRRAGRGEEAT
jgi:hypothetical protein